MASILPSGVAGDFDRIAFEMIATLVSRFRDGSMSVMNSLRSAFDSLTPSYGLKFESYRACHLHFVPKGRD